MPRRVALRIDSDRSGRSYSDEKRGIALAIGWAFIGTGRHPDSRVAPAMVLAEDTEIIAAYSRDQQRADAFATKHGARAAYTSVEALLDDSRVDAVFIASPNHLHAPYTKLAAQAGKHVLVEKPLSTTASEGLEMIKACRAHGVKPIANVKPTAGPRRRNRSRSS